MRAHAFHAVVKEALLPSLRRQQRRTRRNHRINIAAANHTSQKMHSSPPDLEKLSELFPSSDAHYQSIPTPKTIENTDKIALKSMTREEMKNWLVSIDEKPSRVEQLIASMYRRRQGNEDVNDDAAPSISYY